MKSEFYRTTLKMISLKQDLLNLCSVDESFKTIYYKFLETLGEAEKIGLMDREGTKNVLPKRD